MVKLSFNHRLITRLVFILFLVLQTTTIYSARDYKKNSVLSSGKWVKIKIEETGVYKLTHDDLIQMGFENPKNVKVFGYGGNIQTEDFGLNEYIDDLPQVAVWMSSPTESFGANDYILFYGKGTIKWSYDKAKKEFVQIQNPYSSEAYYFLTESTDGTKTAETVASPPSDPATNVTYYQDYLLHEKELVNISQTGRNFYGESFTTNRSQNFEFNIEETNTSNALISYEFISLPTEKATVTTSLNGINPRSRSIAVPTDSYAVADTATDLYNQAVKNGKNILNFQYIEGSGFDLNVHLNYFRVTYNRKLQPYGAVTPFRSTELSYNLKFSIANTPEKYVVFNTTDASNMKVIEGDQNGNILEFSSSNIPMQEYAFIDLSKEIPKPTYVKNVSNQNLHSLENREMVIIVQPSLKDQAEQLAKIHFEDSGLESLIVYPEDIYNEFSSGTPDATAYRSFLKMLYDRSKSQSKTAPKYLLLFGDGTYDNRFIGDQWNKTETNGILLTYQSANSVSELNSYTSDDYFGFLDDDEGKLLNADKLDIGIGRLPARTPAEAQALVNKTQQYVKNEHIGDWQNKILLVADDAIGSASSDSKDERVHMRDSDTYAKYLNIKHPDFNITKHYFDSFERISTNSMIRHPEGKKQFLNYINSGSLVLNFMGHGSYNSWTHELILVGADIENMKNEKLPLWITATCDFSRFDNDATSAGELALLNPDGGAIALFSTVRVVFASSNKSLNTAIYNHIFTEENDKTLRLGDIMKYAKTLSSDLIKDTNKLRFLVLGDPALRLNYPSSKYNVQLESINNLATDGNSIVLNALSEVKVKGKIVGKAGVVNSDFNGTIDIRVQDNELQLKTRGQINKNTTVSSDSVSLKYKDYINELYSGKAVVNNGMFEFSFIVPKDIVYAGDNGKMFFMAYDLADKKMASGSFTNYKVTGAGSTSISKETTPPSIEKLYLNEESFVSGNTISNGSLLVANISDNTGLNLSPTLGHGITATINGTNYDITSSFISASSKSGRIEYSLPTLPSGSHTLVLKVWDIWNNSSTKTIEFAIEENDSYTYSFGLDKDIVKDNIRFTFTNESKKSEIHAKYQVYDQSGNLKWTREDKGKSTLFANQTYEWNLVADDGKKLSPGLYTCVLKIKIGNTEEVKKYDFVVL